MGPDKLKTLVERTAKTLNIEAHLDLEPLSHRSLRQIGEILRRMVEQQQGTGEDQPISTAAQSTWCVTM
ncbi:hypothetical protein [Desulfosarcina cetonica]|uniref:hypothetical protein n=1 Tax=Desulfosarcina cetonica TaxID=90730 RepID=UPI0006D13B34|nr:hypothetical protein [Desulfosarcina cetonica]